MCFIANPASRWHKGRWLRLAHQGSGGEVSIQVGLNANQSDWQQQAVSVEVDNFRLTAQQADCP